MFPRHGIFFFYFINQSNDHPASKSATTLKTAQKHLNNDRRARRAGAEVQDNMRLRAFESHGRSTVRPIPQVLIAQLLNTPNLQSSDTVRDQTKTVYRERATYKGKVYRYALVTIE